MSDEKMVREEPKFCVDCAYYDEEKGMGAVCKERPDAISLVTGGPATFLMAWQEREEQGSNGPMAASYEPCGSGAKHWKAKEEG